MSSADPSIYQKSYKKYVTIEIKIKLTKLNDNTIKTSKFIDVVFCTFIL
jgi:type IV secretory pathway component VirB8